MKKCEFLEDKKGSMIICAATPDKPYPPTPFQRKEFCNFSGHKKCPFYRNAKKLFAEEER